MKTKSTRRKTATSGAKASRSGSTKAKKANATKARGIRAKGQEPRAKRQETRAKGLEPSAKRQGPRAKGLAKSAGTERDAAAELVAAGPRRAIFVDVENTSSVDELTKVFDHLQIDRARQRT